MNKLRDTGHNKNTIFIYINREGEKMTPMEKLKEEMIELIESKIGSKASGTTVNFHNPEGGGTSSCAIEKQKDGAKVTVKAYSSDLDKLEATVTTAMDQYNRAMSDLNKELYNND